MKHNGMHMQNIAKLIEIVIFTQTKWFSSVFEAPFPISNEIGTPISEELWCIFADLHRGDL
jgi:hypothetical protein